MSVLSWEKLGLVLAPSQEVKWMTTFASSTAVKVVDEKEGLIDIFVTGRDDMNRSLIGCVKFNVFKHEVIEISKEEVLNLGPLGTFDENGQSYPSYLFDGDKECLYYTGWSPSVLTPFQNFVGLGVRKKGEEKFCRYSNAPVLDRNNEDYSSIGSCYVLKSQDHFKMWYTAFRNWEKTENGTRHYYRIKYAHSKDGVNWERDNAVCIDFESENEYAIARPTVFELNGEYNMMYCYRGDKYRLGYATSKDGINWTRRDNDLMFVGDDLEFDSYERNYPTVFSLNGDHYLLYSGNNYGEAGFGIAKLIK